MGGPRGRLLPGDDRPARGPARGARPRAGVLEPRPATRAARTRWNDQGAVLHRRWAPAGGGRDALRPSSPWRRPREEGSRRPRPRELLGGSGAPLDLPLLTVGLPADVQLLRDRRDALRAQPHVLGDHRAGSALPP